MHVSRRLRPGQSEPLTSRSSCIRLRRRRQRNAAIRYKARAAAGSFHARDNITQFVQWAKDLGVTVHFEADDLVQNRNEKNVLYCIMEMARVQGGIPPPRLVQIERQIDRGT